MVSWCLRPVSPWYRGRGPAPGFTPACSARPPAAIICTTTGEPWRVKDPGSFEETNMGISWYSRN